MFGDNGKWFPKMGNNNHTKAFQCIFMLYDYKMAWNVQFVAKLSILSIWGNAESTIIDSFPAINLQMIL